MAKLSIILIVICIGGFVTSLFRSNPKESSASSGTTGLNAAFQQQINAVGQRQQRKKVSTHTKIPLKGNEVSLASLITRPEKYRKKPFVIFGQIRPDNSTQIKKAPFTFRFQELTVKRQPIPQATAKLQLEGKQAETLIKQIQQKNQTLLFGRFHVTFIPSQEKASPLKLEILDWQFGRDDNSGFDPWNTAPPPSS